MTQTPEEMQMNFLKDQFKDLKDTLKEIVTEVKTKSSNEKVDKLQLQVDKKLDIDDFAPYKKVLDNMNRLAIAAIMSALIYLVVKIKG